MKPPPKIYKYESFGAQSLHNLKSQHIYFGSPKGFNDGYDCALEPKIEPPTDVEIEQLRQHFLKMPNLPAHLHGDFEKADSTTLRTMFTNTVTGLVQQMKDDFLNTKGVTCFSETPDNLLMWSHYAGKSQGFCLEFDTTIKPFDSDRLFPVTYSETIPTVKVTSDLLLRSDDTSLIKKLYCTKSRDWAYEREWRAIHHQKGTAYGYPSNSLTGIYFGPDATGPSQEIVCLILLGQNTNVRFYQGIRSRDQFKVEFKPFAYTPHLEAKKLGLIK